MPLKPKRLEPGEQATLSLTIAQVELLTQEGAINERLLSLLYTSRVYDKVVRVRCTLDDLAQLSKYVADEVSNSKDEALRQQHDEILEAIRTVEQSYDRTPLRIVPNRLGDFKTD